MNTYKIIFTRENGTQGTDHFTAINERQARKDFGECYRHSTATIISIELASTNTPATKQQERDTLEKIRKMVEQLGPDSYLATAFEGCFDLAAENIDNDWACSMADRARKLFTEGVVQNTDGTIAYNLMQNDMVALRAVMRLGWEIPNPVNAMAKEKAKRFPFAVLTPANA